MKARYVNELVEGGRVDAVFALRSREMRAARNGDAYLAVEVSDKTGSIPGVLFRPGPAAAAVPTGTAVRVSGTVTSFRGVKRVSIDRLEPADEWESSELLGSGRRSREELTAEFAALARTVHDAGLRRLLRTIFSDKGFYDAFCACPASQSYHHAYLGGLLEHTVSVASACVEAAGRYDGVDADLLVTAALVHDIGKVDELASSVGISYTDEGRLLGHVVTSVMRVREAARAARLTGDTLLHLEHAVLSHHGELEWGSPKRPATLEALLLHHVDNLDAKAAAFVTLLEGASLIEENWTDASNLFRRPLYAPKAIEDERPTRPTEDDQHFRMTA